MSRLAPILQQYFTTYVLTQRALSPATIRTYRDSWALLLTFLAERTQIPPYALDLAHIDHGSVTAFLDHLENERGNSIATRNLRLAAIKAVLTFHCATMPEHLDTIAAVQAIPVKKHPRRSLTYLTTTQVQALLDAIDTTTWTGRRDQAMFALAAHTGLRVSELISLTVDSVHLGTVAYVACTGKGRKHRITPLTTATATLLKTYLCERRTRPGHALFPNPRGEPLSADAITQRLRTHVHHAARSRPELADTHITVHTLRHTAAMRFLAAGIDTAVIALWLGHESTATTSIYLHADMDIKRRALERTRQPETVAGDYTPSDSLLAWLQAL